MARYLYSELAKAVSAYQTCREKGNTEWANRHEDVIDLLVSMLPSGSGFDSGTKIHKDRSHRNKLVFDADFHHMDDNGYYAGWTEHVVTVIPSFDGFDLRISGRNRNDIKEYISEQFHYALMQDVEYALMINFPWPALEPHVVKVERKWIDKCTMRWYVGGMEFNRLDLAQARAVEIMLQT